MSEIDLSALDALAAKAREDESLARELARALRAAGLKSQKKAAIEAVAREMASNWVDAPSIIVVDSMEDPRVPLAIRLADQRGRREGAMPPKGFMVNGVIFVVAEQCTSVKDAVVTITHEAVGHLGLRGVLGDSFRETLELIADVNPERMAKKARAYGLDLSRQSDRLEAAEEVLAELAESGRQLSEVERARAEMRLWLRSVVPSMAQEPWSDEELIYAFVEPAREFLAGQRPGGSIADRFDLASIRNVMGLTDARMSGLERLYGYHDGRTKAALTWISPEDFLAATTSEKDKASLAREGRVLDLSALREEIQTPYLDVVKEGASWRISSFEGRHRMQALRDAGISVVPLVVVRSRAAAGDFGAEISGSFIEPWRDGDLVGEKGVRLGHATSVSLDQRASRLARAQYATDGLVRFSKSVRLQPQLWHGSARAFRSFDSALLNTGVGYADQGSGVYLTTDRDGYARYFAREAAGNARALAALNGERAQAEDALGVVHRANLRPDLRVLDLDRDQLDPVAAEALLSGLGGLRPETLAGIAVKELCDPRRVLFDLLRFADKEGSIEMGEAVRRLGYDAISFEEPRKLEGHPASQGARTFVVYDPSAVTFEPEDPVEHPSFAPWFSESVMTQTGRAGGAPRVYFHGTDRPFDGVGHEFAQSNEVGDYGAGIYFTADRTLAEGYAKKRGSEAARVVEAYLKIERPYEVLLDIDKPQRDQKFTPLQSREQARKFSAWLAEHGYDGVVVRHVEYAADGSIAEDYGIEEVMVLRGDQVRALPAVEDGSSIDFRMRLAPGFYSALEQAVATKMPRDKQGGIRVDQALSWLLAQKGKLFKSSELEWSGLVEFLESQAGRIAVDRIAEFVSANGVEVHERILEAGKGDAASLHEALAQELYGGPYDGLSERAQSDVRYQADRRVQARGEVDGTKFRRWGLVGGVNYKELLLTLPESFRLPPGYQLREGAVTDWDRQVGVSAAWEVVHSESGDLVCRGGTQQDAIKGALANLNRADGVYRSPHWDESNVIAHVRFDERLDAEGRRVLFVQEIQSDWAQQGRRSGFARELSPEERARLDQAREDVRAISDAWGGLPQLLRAVASNDKAALEARSRQAELRAEVAAIEQSVGIVPASGVRIASGRVGGLAVPAGPFVSSTDAWVTLAVKRIIRWAAENDFDAVAFASGEQNTELFGIRHQVEVVRYRQPVGQSEGDLEAFDAKGHRVIARRAQASELPAILGKEVAQRLLEVAPLAEENSSNRVYELAGEVLEIQGEGMQAFYDRILPKVVRDVLGKLGGPSLGTVHMPTLGTRWAGHYSVESHDGAGSAGSVVKYTSPQGKVSYRGAGGWVDSPALATRYEVGVAREIVEEASQGGLGEQVGFDMTEQLRAAAMAGVPRFRRAAGEDLFPLEFADRESTVQQRRLLSSRGPEMVTLGNLNSAGQQIAVTVQGLERFWAFYGDGPCDEEGRPLVLFHSTNSDFSEFETNRPSVTSTTFGPVDTRRQAIFATPDRDFSQGYLRSGGGGNVMPVYMRLRNPLDLRDGINGSDLDSIISASGGTLNRADFYRVPADETWQFFDDEFGERFVEAARLAGFDGAVLVESDGERQVETYACFDPRQVKSALGNRGSFSVDEEDIRFRRDDQAQERLASFMDGSHVTVDGQPGGEPRLVYHGTAASFSRFAGGRGAFYFAGDPGVAEAYAKEADGTDDDGPNVMPVYLRMLNPLVLDEEWATENLGAPEDRDWTAMDEIAYQAEADGHDGVILKGVVDFTGIDEAGNRREAPYDQFLVFDARQIKSATGNRGTFDSANPDIRFRRDQPAASIEMMGTKDCVARVNGRVVGQAHAGRDWEGNFCIQEVAVHPSLRRRGIATAMYRAIEEASGHELSPAPSLSDDGFAFWCAYRPSAVRDDLRHRRQELLGRKVMKRGRVGTIFSVSGRSVTARYDDATERANSETTLSARDLDTALVPLSMTDTPAFRAYFGQSVVTKDGRPGGEPLVVYHGTDSDFAVFERGDVGYHFGPATAANNRVNSGRHGDGSGMSSPRLMPVYLAIRNPLRMADVGDWSDPDRVATFIGERMADDDVFEQAWMRALEASAETGGGPRAFTDILERMGYDGIVYENVAEGGGDSWIAFHPEQIKSAVGNNGQYDGSNPDIRFRRAEDVALDERQSAWCWGNETARNGVPMVLYHGAGRDLTAVRGPSFWASTTPVLANLYAEMRSQLGEPACVIPVQLRVGSCFDADRLPGTVTVRSFFTAVVEQARAAGREVDDAQVEVLIQSIRACARREESGPYYGRHDFWYESRTLFGDDGARAAAELFRVTGFDSVRMTEHGELTYGVFSAEQVRFVLAEGAIEAGSDSQTQADGDQAPYEQTPTFQAFFAGSKAVNEDGTPRVLYHGTNFEFGEFEVREGAFGIFLTPDPAVASTFATVRKGGSPLVMPVYASIRRPWTMIRYGEDVPYSQMKDQSREALIAEGYDGVYRPEDGVWIAFHSEQVRSVFGDRAIDGADPELRFRRDETSRQAARDQVYRELASDEEVVAAIEDWISDGKLPPAHINDRLLAYMRRLPSAAADGYLTFYRGQPKGAIPWARGWASWTVDASQVRYFQDARESEILVRKGAQGIDLGEVSLWRTRLTGVRHEYGGQGEWLVLNESVFSPAAETVAPRVYGDVRQSPQFKAWYAGSRLVEDGAPIRLYHGTQSSFDEFDGLRQGGASDAGWYGAGFYFTPDADLASAYATSAGASGGHVMPVYVRLENPYDWRAENERGLYANNSALSLQTTADLISRGHDGVVVYEDTYRLGEGESLSDEQWRMLTSASPVLAVIGRERVAESLRGREWAHDDLAKHYGLDFVRTLPRARRLKEVVAFRPEQVKSAIGNRGSFDPRTPDIRFRRDARTEASEEFKAWAKGTVVAEADGSPKVVYHGTLAYDFDPAEFDLYGLQSHFGTAEQAEGRLQFLSGKHTFATAWSGQYGDRARVIPVYLQLVNPLRLRDLKTWDTHDLLAELAKMGVISPEEREAVERRWEVEMHCNEDDGRELVKEVLFGKGYDGIVYANRHESREVGADSYHVFSAAQIRSAFGVPAPVGPTDSPDGGAPPDRDEADAAAAEREEERHVTDTPAFRAYFGQSVVTKDGRPGGEPLVVYHGTGQDFSAFSASASSIHIPLPGFFFSPDPGVASGFAESAAKISEHRAGRPYAPIGANVIPAYLRMVNPMEIDGSAAAHGGRMPSEKVIEGLLKAAMAKGHDGAIIKGWTDGSGPIQYVVFSAGQIKSALGNNGEFDRMSDDIRFRRDPVQPRDSQQAFREWFGASVVTQDLQAGSPPRVMYHGTAKSFDAFADPFFEPRGENFGRKDHWHYFTPDPEVAGGYAAHADRSNFYLFSDPNSARANVMPVYVSITNPLIVRPPAGWESLDGDGSGTAYMDLHRAEFRQAYLDGLHDGVVILNADGSLAGVATEFPSAIKSAIGNNGSYDPDNDDIRFRRTPVDEDSRDVRDTPAFARWFQDSVMVGPDGKAQVFYHGTNESFDAFDPERSREDGSIFVSSSARSASDFALYRSTWSGANVMPVYVRARRLLEVSGNWQLIRKVEEQARFDDMLYGEDLRSYARRLGYDGIAFRNVIEDIGPDIPTSADVFALFEGASIKSAIGNRGTFDETLSDVRFRRAETAEVRGVSSLDRDRALEAWFAGSVATEDGLPGGAPKRLYHGTGADFSVFRAQGGSGKTADTGAFFSSSPETAATYATGEQPAVMPVYLRLLKPMVVDAGGANWSAIKQAAKVYLPRVEVSDQADEDLLAALEGRVPQAGATKVLRERRTTVRALFKGEWDYFDDTASTDDLARWARAQGYDGLVIRNVKDHGPSGRFSAAEAREPSDLYVAFSAGQIKSALGNNGQYDGSNPDIRFRREDPSREPALPAALSFPSYRQGALGEGGLFRPERLERLERQYRAAGLVQVAAGGEGDVWVEPDEAEFLRQHGFGRSHLNCWALHALQIIRAGHDPEALRGAWGTELVEHVGESEEEATLQFERMVGAARAWAQDHEAPGRPKVLYHHSPRANRESILAKGILGSDATSPGGDRVVFLSSRATHQPEMDVWEVDVADLLLAKDWTKDAPGGEDWYVATGDLEPQRIRGMHAAEVRGRRLEDTPAFQAFFAGSKAVNEDGTPKVLYHGTIVRDSARAPGMGDIKTFDRLFSTQFRAHSIDTVGSWFSSNPGDGGAEMYAGRMPGSVVYPVYLAIKNPHETTFRLMCRRARLLANGEDDGRMIGEAEVNAYRTWLKTIGKDGIKIVHDPAEPDSTEFLHQDAWVALEPEQIMSALGDGTGFNRTDADVRFRRAWHGSPRAGIREFSTEAMGQGAGAQSYGWGLYFSDSRDVAVGYRALSNDLVVQVGGREVRPSGEAQSLAFSALRSHEGDLEATLETLRRQAGAGGEGLRAQAARFLEGLVLDGATVKLGGAVYEVEVPDDSALLDWHAPLEQQPAAVRAALGCLQEVGRHYTPETFPAELAVSGGTILCESGVLFSLRPEGSDAVFPLTWEDVRRLTGQPGTGANIYQALAQRLGSLEAASKRLHALGVKGVVYREGEARNFVIFSPSDARVVSPQAAAAPLSMGDFTRWIGRSRIRDGAGTPRVMYRGSMNADARPFLPDGLVFLTDHRETAEIYARGGQLHEFYVRCEAPFDASRGDGLRLWREFVAEKSLPSWASAGTERGALPFWSVEHDLRAWLDTKGIAYDGIWFAEASGRASLAVRSIDQVLPIGKAPQDVSRACDPDLYDRDLARGQAKARFRRDDGSAHDGLGAWNRGNKLVRPDGEPLVLFHGTSADFTVFRPSKRGTFGSGIYLTEDPGVAAEFFRGDTEAAPSVMPLHAVLRNPFYVTADFAVGEEKWDFDSPTVPLIEAIFGDSADAVIHGAREGDGQFGEEVQARLEAMGHDGIVVNWAGQEGGREFIVFSPAAVKSAIGNVGTYSTSDFDIRFAREVAGGAPPAAVVDRLAAASLVNMGYSRQEAEDPEVHEFLAAAARAHREEKQSSPDDWTVRERAAWDRGDWREFSRIRGYSESAIANFGRFVELAERLDFRYGEDFSAGLDHSFNSGGISGEEPTRPVDTQGRADELASMPAEIGFWEYLPEEARSEIAARLSALVSESGAYPRLAELLGATDEERGEEPLRHRA